MHVTVQTLFKINMLSEMHIMNEVDDYPPLSYGQTSATQFGEFQ